MALDQLRVIARYEKDGVKGEKQAIFPLETDEHRLPDEYPFNRNVYLGPDYGYSLSSFHLNVENRYVVYGYGDRIPFDETGKAVWKETIRPDETVEVTFLIE